MRSTNSGNDETSFSRVSLGATTVEVGGVEAKSLRFAAKGKKRECAMACVVLAVARARHVPWAKGDVPVFGIMELHNTAQRAGNNTVIRS